MRGADATSLAQLAAGGQQTATRVDLLNTFTTTGAGSVFASTDANVSDARIHVVDGDWSQDEGRDIFTEANITLMIDNSEQQAWIPLTSVDPLSPVSATEFQLYLGFVDPATGLPLLGSVGVFDFSTNDIEHIDGGLTMKLTGFDRSRRLLRARFTKPYVIAAGSVYTTVIQNLVKAILPNVTIRVTASTYKTPYLSFDADVELTYLDMVNKLASSIGYSVWFDNLGRCQIQPTQDSGADPQWDFFPGSDVRLLSSRRSLSDEKTYNGVIMRGEPTSSNQPPVQGEAWDVDQKSPTYYDPLLPSASKYGPVPFFEVSEFVVTIAQAYAAAKARLPKVKGLVERVQFETRYNPYMEAGDVVSLAFPEIQASGVYVVEAIASSIHADTMKVTTRERRLDRPI